MDFRFKKIGLSVFLFLVTPLVAAEKNIYIVDTKKLASQKLQYDGTVIPCNVVEIVSPGKTSLKAKHFNFGDHVEKDQLLFELTSLDLETRLNQAKIELFENEQALEKLKYWQTSREMQEALYNVNKLKQESFHAKQHFEQTKKLFEAGIVSKEEYFSDKRTNEDKQHQFEESKKFLSDVKKRGEKRFLKLAQLKATTAKQQVELLNAKVAMLSMRAPIEGIILPAQRQGENKDSWRASLNQISFQESQTMALIAENKSFYVRLKVDEFDVVHLAKNMQARITFAALGKETVQGKIQEINVEPPMANDTHQIGSFNINLLLEDIPLTLKDKLLIGMSAIVKFEPPALEGLFVPKQAITYENEVAYVNVLEANQQRKQKVILGQTTPDYVLVQEGLQKGAQIVLYS